MRTIISDMLTAHGHRPLVCTDGASALRSLDRERFDLALTDLGMPGVGGWDVAAGVKRQRPGTPVGLVTGWGDSVDPAEAAARGVDFVLVKPFDLEQLGDALAGLAGTPGAHR